MKRIRKISYSVVIILLIPFSMVIGQNKKSEQKIRIVVDDGSGTKVVVDTVYHNTPLPDSINLKDGTVVYLKHKGENMEQKHHRGNGHICVNDSSESNCCSHMERNCKKYRVISKNSGEDGEKEHTVIVYKDKSPEKRIEKSVNISVSENGEESADGKSSYIIAKDGIVVTVEGSDEARMKDLVKDIQDRLNVKNEVKEKKETVKVEVE
jgi:hypothetical protein